MQPTPVLIYEKNMNTYIQEKYFVNRLRSGIACATAALAVAMLTCVSIPAAAADPSDPVALAEAALDAWRMEEVNALLASLPNTVEGDYVRGIAANRSNDIAASTRALQRALPGLESKHSAKAVEALLTLSDDYQKTMSYAEQAKTLRLAIGRYADQMKPDVLTGARTVLELATALSNSPPQTVSFAGESELPIRRNPLGTLDVEAIANGVSATWMLDSGANYSVVSASFAKRLHLDIIGKISGIGSVTGIKVDGQLAIVKDLALGSATLHNVVVLVLSDEHLHIKLSKVEYQISAVLGYPVFQGLGRISFIGEKSILIGAKSIAATDGVQLLMDSLTPIAMLASDGLTMPFILDTGATATDLSYTYWVKAADRVSSWPRSQRQSAGLGGTKTFEKVVLPEWEVVVGKDKVVLKDIEVETQRKPEEGDQPMYGRLGQDLWKNAAGFTIDFRSMRFRIEK
jgi:predicted aspartyl protease